MNSLEVFKVFCRLVDIDHDSQVFPAKVLNLSKRIYIYLYGFQKDAS